MPRGTERYVHPWSTNAITKGFTCRTWIATKRTVPIERPAKRGEPTSETLTSGCKAKETKRTEQWQLFIKQYVPRHHHIALNSKDQEESTDEFLRRQRGKAENLGVQNLVVLSKVLKPRLSHLATPWISLPQRTCSKISQIKSTPPRWPRTSAMPCSTNILHVLHMFTSIAAQGGGGSFKDRTL